jgi:mRNA export factor
MADYKNPNTEDALVVNSPAEGISSLSFSPTQDVLVASCWDKKVYAWGYQGGQTQAKALTEYKAPVLCTSFSDDGSQVFSGDCENKAMMWNLQTNQQQQVGVHQAPIKECFWIKEKKLLVTGGWDKCLRYWDLRQNVPAGEVKLPERVYCMDMTFPVLTVGCADQHIVIYNLNNPQTAYKATKSQLQMQTRCISNFRDQQGNTVGYAVGSIEGRVSIKMIHVDDKKKDFAFRCHRTGHNQSNLHAVNSIKFHSSGRFATCGADGTYVFWDKENRRKLKPSKTMGNSITCSAFSRDYNIFAYALSYDWSMGISHYQNKKTPNAIYLHRFQV